MIVFLHAFDYLQHRAHPPPTHSVMRPQKGNSESKFFTTNKDRKLAKLDRGLIYCWILLVNMMFMVVVDVIKLVTIGDVMNLCCYPAQWNVVSTKITHDIARLARKGF